MIPLRALGVLIDMVSHSSVPTVKDMMVRYGVGKDLLQKDLKFLRENGYAILEKGKINDRIVSYYRVTDNGIKAIMEPLFKGLSNEDNYRIFRLLYEHTLQTSNSLLEANKSLKSLSRGEEKMPYEFFGKTSSEDEDIKSDREKHLARKQSDKQELYERKQLAKREKQRFIRREELSKAVWRPLDIAREFADRLEDYWHISPLNLVESRFVPALAEARLKHNTNGEIEFVMLQLYFEAMDFQKHTDSDRLWRTFISRFNEFAVKARLMLVSEKQVEHAKEQADKSWENF
jgi:hypothetical protein